MTNTLINLFPLSFYIFYLVGRFYGGTLKRAHQIAYVLFLTILALSLAAIPINDSYDRENYTNEFLGLTNERDSDIGWTIYNKIIYFFAGGQVFLFFFITSLIYCFSYLFYFNKNIQKQYVGYMLILVTGSLGFTNYGYNTIRAGLAIAWVIIAMSVRKKLILKIMLLFISIITHYSILLPIASYLFSLVLKKKRVVEIIWCICLMFSIFHLDFMNIFANYFSEYDVRIDKYIDAYNLEYKMGFRIDFVIYSLIPIYIANVLICKYHYYSRFYYNIYKTYLLSNSFWLLAMRIPFTDRIAYLSWFMIPILVLYPLLSGEIRLNNVHRKAMMIIGFFIGINLLLSLR